MCIYLKLDDFDHEKARDSGENVLLTVKKIFVQYRSLLCALLINTECWPKVKKT